MNLDAAFDGIVYSLFDCSPDAQELGCAGNREDLVLNYDGPGTYFIVVDSQDGAGQFTLNIERRVTIELCEGVQKGLPDGGVPEADSGLDAGLDASLDAGIAAPAHDAGLMHAPDLATPDANRVADDARVSPRDAGQPMRVVRSTRCGRSSDSAVATAAELMASECAGRCQYVRDARYGHATA